MKFFFKLREILLHVAISNIWFHDIFFAGVDAQDALLKGLQDLKAVTAYTKKVFIQAVADSKLN